jgi:hypothetical protein
LGGGGAQDDQLAVLLAMFGYFNAITAARREHPTDDLAAATHSIQHQLRAGFTRRAVGQAAEEMDVTTGT